MGDLMSKASGDKGGKEREPKQSSKEPPADAAKSDKPTLAIPNAKCVKGKYDLPAHYVTGSSIGTGSYGSVIQGKDLSKNSRPVAIKRIENLFEELTDCKRILREFSLLARLDSPHIISLYDFIIPKDLSKFQEVYIVMEICDSDLKKLVKTDVTLELDHVKTLLYGLLAGCKYLHSAGVVHRDLKPANVLCNQDCTVKICDFGLSRTLPPEQLHIDGHHEEGHPDDVEHTEPPPVPPQGKKKKEITKHVVTRWYRAPEVILREPKQTGQLDVWSVGCIFAELLQMLEGNHFYDRGPLFPGHSCFPLSPAHRSRHAQNRSGQPRNKYDQLVIILTCMGTPSAEEISRLAPGEGKIFMERLAHEPGDGLKSRLPLISDECLDLLSKLLRFGTVERITVDGALQHEFLQKVHKPENALVAPGPLKIPFDTEGHLSESQLRTYFGDEKRRFDEKQAADAK